MTSTPPPSSFSWRSLLQFGLSGLVSLFLWGAAAYMLVIGLSPLFAGGSIGSVDPAGFLIAAGFAWMGALLMPSAWFALLRLVNRPAATPRLFSWQQLWPVILFMVPVVGIGYWASITPAVAWLLLPPLNVLALSIPIVWYLSLGGRGLRSASPQTAWGVFGTGLALGPGVILVIELIGAVIGVIVLVIWLSPEPGFVEELQRLALTFQNASTVDPNELLPFAEKYLMRNSVLVGGLLFIAVFVPLLEEFFKPIGLWLMKKQTLTPARGFLAGMLSGAAFGLFESLLQGVAGEEWVILPLTRAGTSLIHIFNSGLVGWGFALAWQQRSPIPWLKRYLLAVLIHGLWNGSTVMLSLAYIPEQTLVGEVWGPVGMAILGMLSLGCFVSLVLINRRLQTEEAATREATLPPTSEPTPEEGPLSDSTSLSDPDAPSDPVNSP